MKFDWLRVFWPTSQEQDFSQTGLVQEQANNKHIHYRANSVKINDQIFLQIQETYF